MIRCALSAHPHRRVDQATGRFIKDRQKTMQEHPPIDGFGYLLRDPDQVRQRGTRRPGEPAREPRGLGPGHSSPSLGMAGPVRIGSGCLPAKVLSPLTQSTTPTTSDPSHALPCVVSCLLRAARGRADWAVLQLAPFGGVPLRPWNLFRIWTLKRPAIKDRRRTLSVASADRRVRLPTFQDDVVRQVCAWCVTRSLLMPRHDAGSTAGRSFVDDAGQRSFVGGAPVGSTG